MSCLVDSLDHLVLTVRDIRAAVSFYVNVLGMTEIHFNGRVALAFGSQKINLHEAGQEIVPHASEARPGSADLCFLSSTPIEVWLRHLDEVGATVELGPVRRTGALGPILSLYLRDPDGNLIEVSNQLTP